MVTWSAGKPPAFPVVLEVVPDEAGAFPASFAYWGPMLIQARLHFEDGRVEAATIYARVPSGESEAPGPRVNQGGPDSDVSASVAQNGWAASTVAPSKKAAKRAPKLVKKLGKGSPQTKGAKKRRG
jgi:hypothetical protein